MAGGVINLGQVAFVDKGVYSSSVTYKRFNFIVTDDSCYLSLKDGNIGHAITDSTWWKCLAKGSQATEESVGGHKQGFGSGSESGSSYCAGYTAGRKCKFSCK